MAHWRKARALLLARRMRQARTSLRRRRVLRARPERPARPCACQRRRAQEHPTAPVYCAPPSAATARPSRVRAACSLARAACSPVGQRPMRAHRGRGWRPAARHKSPSRDAMPSPWPRPSRARAVRSQGEGSRSHTPVASRANPARLSLRPHAPHRPARATRSARQRPACVLRRLPCTPERAHPRAIRGHAARRITPPLASL